MQINSFWIKVCLPIKIQNNISDMDAELQRMADGEISVETVESINSIFNLYKFDNRTIIEFNYDFKNIKNTTHQIKREALDNKISFCKKSIIQSHFISFQAMLIPPLNSEFKNKLLFGVIINGNEFQFQYATDMINTGKNISDLYLSDKLKEILSCIKFPDPSDTL